MLHPPCENDVLDRWYQDEVLLGNFDTGLTLSSLRQLEVIKTNCINQLEIVCRH